MLWLVVARVALAVFPFRWVAAWFGAQGLESPATLSHDDVARARVIRGRIRGMRRRLHWFPPCLVQGTAAMMLLRRRGVAATLYLGVAPGTDGAGMRAHAWVRSGPVYVTGGRERHEFRVIGTFALPSWPSGRRV